MTNPLLTAARSRTRVRRIRRPATSVAAKTTLIATLLLLLAFPPRGTAELTYVGEISDYFPQGEESAPWAGARHTATLRFVPLFHPGHGEMSFDIEGNLPGRLEQALKPYTSSFGECVPIVPNPLIVELRSLPGFSMSVAPLPATSKGVLGPWTWTHGWRVEFVNPSPAVASFKCTFEGMSVIENHDVIAPWSPSDDGTSSLTTPTCFPPPVLTDTVEYRGRVTSWRFTRQGVLTNTAITGCRQPHLKSYGVSPQLHRALGRLYRVLDRRRALFQFSHASGRSAYLNVQFPPDYNRNLAKFQQAARSAGLRGPTAARPYRVSLP